MESAQIKRNLGFTLIELLIVIAVLGVLASVLVIAINPLTQFKRARDARRKADLKSVQSALELYRSDQNNYPPSPLPGCKIAFTGPSATPTYLAGMPCDPLNSTIYLYSPLPSGCDNVTSVTTCMTYSLAACLENTKDPDVAGAPACGSGRVYTVTNP